MEQDLNFGRLIKKSRYEIPDRNFENRVMQKVSFAVAIRKTHRRNLKLSWMFLAVSTLLLPLLLILISRSFFLKYLSDLGLNIGGAAHMLMPAAVLVSVIIILVQADNLYRLTLHLRY